MPIELDRRSYFALTRSQFTVDGSEPRRAFRRLGTLRPELRALLGRTPEGAEGVRKYHRLLFMGYLSSLLAGLLAGTAMGSFLLAEVLAAMQAAREMTPLLQKAYRILTALPTLRLIFMAVPLFLLAFVVDYLSYRSILETIDKASEPRDPSP